jgi:hypothetical protein
MQYRLRTLLIVLALAPPAIAFVAASFQRGNDGVLRFDWPDPVLITCAFGWIFVWLTVINQRRSLEA